MWKVSHAFNQLLTLSKNLLKIFSFNLQQVYRCVCHLLIAGRVLYLSSGQCCHTQSPWHYGFGVGNTGVFITTSNSPDLSLVAYTICGVINSMHTRYQLCVQNVNKLKRLLDVRYGMEHIMDSAVITNGAFHKRV